jgi:hypothetical protein
MNSAEQNPSWKTDSYSANKRIPRILCNPIFYSSRSLGCQTVAMQSSSVPEYSTVQSVERQLTLPAFMSICLIRCLAYSLALKMEETISSEISADSLRTTKCYIPEGRIISPSCSEGSVSGSYPERD